MSDSLYLNDMKHIDSFGMIAGVDEAGRGPLAGPVLVAAVVIDPYIPIPWLDDSKKLTAVLRAKLYDQIILTALDYHIVCVDESRIDALNILQATLVGMKEAVLGLSRTPHLALIDGNICPPELPCLAKAVIKGDAKYACIAAASILAKVTRDRLMLDLHTLYPQYGFDRHKGYPTPFHLSALKLYGVSPIHRRSFKPVSDLLLD